MVVRSVCFIEIPQSKRCLPEGYRKEQQQEDVRGWRHRCRRDAAEEVHPRVRDRSGAGSMRREEVRECRRRPSARRHTRRLLQRKERQ